MGAIEGPFKQNEASRGLVVCQTLPGLPRAARPSGRFAFGKTPRIEYILVST